MRYLISWLIALVLSVYASAYKLQAQSAFGTSSPAANTLVIPAETHIPVKLTYNKLTDSTTVIGRMAYHMNVHRTFGLYAMAFYPGQEKPKLEPVFYAIIFEHDIMGGDLQEPVRLLLDDSVRIQLTADLAKSSYGDIGKQNYILMVTRDEMRQIANAKKLEGALGPEHFELNEKNIINLVSPWAYLHGP